MSPTPPVQPLTYAASPSPAGLRIDRSADRLLIEISAPTRHVKLLLLLIGLTVPFAGGFFWLWMSAEKIAEPVRVGLGIFGTAGCFGIAATLGKRLKFILQRATIEVDALNVTFTKRLADRIGRDQWSRSIIAGVRTVPGGWTELLQREYRLELWFINGRGAILYTGPAKSVAILTEAIATALGYPIESAHASSPIRPSRRVTLRNYPTGPEFVLTRPRFSWELIPFLLCALGVGLLLERFVFIDRRGRVLVFPQGEISWSVMRIALVTLVVFASAFEILHRIRRRKILAIQGDKLILIEVSLTSPLRQEWPVKQIATVQAHDDGRLSASLNNGQSVDLLTRENPADMRWICDQIKPRLYAAQPPPPPIVLEYIEPPSTSTIIRIDGATSPKANSPVHTPESPPPESAISNPADHDRPPGT
jgi:hypothetical protein